MQRATKGKVVVAATIENHFDRFEAENGRHGPHDVRRVTVTDAVIDPKATMLLLPTRYVQQLGLTRFPDRTARTAGGPIRVRAYGMAILSVQGREARVEVVEVDDASLVVIGQVPLGILDFVVDPQGQRLVGNPDHGGEQMIEVWSTFPPGRGTQPA